LNSRLARLKDERVAMSNIKVSVISLAFRPGFIDTVVDSLVHQTMNQDEWELILVDDLADRRKEKVAEYMSGRIKNFLHIPPRHIEPGCAPAPAINNGIIHARGELIYFISDRFYASPRCLERHWAIYSKYGPNVIISGPLVTEDKVQFREDYAELTDINAISILKAPIASLAKERPFITIGWLPEYAADGRCKATCSITIDDNLYENRDNAGHRNAGCWWWAGANDSAPLQTLVDVNGLDEAFNGRRGGVDGDCGVRLVSYGCKHLTDIEAPCARLPGTIRKPNLISEEERIRRVVEKRKHQHLTFCPNDYNLRQEREKIGLTTKQAETFDTSVITIHAGPLELLKKCINGIKENTILPYQHVIVADKPDDETSEYLKSLSEEGAKVATNPELIGIERAGNQARRMAEGKYLCFVDTDVVLSPSTIELMRDVLGRNPRFGWVAISSEYTGFFAGCSMITREVMEDVGLLDEEFPGFGFGDDDYLRRVWKAGYKPHIVGGINVSHKSSVSTKTVHSEEEKRSMFLRAQELFHKKHGQWGTNWDALPRYQPYPDEGKISTVKIHRTDWTRSKVTLKDTILEVGSAENPVWGGTNFKVTTLDKSARGLSFPPEQQCFPDVVGKAEDLPFDCMSFDVITLGELLEHVPDPQIVLREAVRVARKKVIVTVPWEHEWLPELKPFENTDHVRFYTPKSFNEELAKLGLPHRVKMIRKGGWAWLGAEIYCDCGGIPMTEQIKKLNIGSFTVMLPSPDWINIDIVDLSAYAREHGFNFRQVDVTRGLPFEDNSIDVINASHLIEHLSVVEGIAFLKQCWRVLKPNSTIRIGTPDINKLVDAYKNREMDKFNDIQPEEYKQAPSQADKFWRLLTASHKTCYDLTAIRHSLELASFEDIYQSDYQAELDKFPEVSLYVEAKKGQLDGKFIPSKGKEAEGVPEYWRQFATGDRMARSFTKPDARALELLLKRDVGILRENPVIADVGSGQGESTLVSAKAILPYRGNVFAINQWTADVYSIFKQKMIEAEVGDIVHPLNMDSEIACQIFNDKTFDLVFIADEGYERVKRNIACWISKVRYGGLLCGQIRNDEVIKVLVEYFEDLYYLIPDSSIWRAKLPSKRDELIAAHPDDFSPEHQWNEEIAVKMLLDMKEIFDARGIKFWLCFGTFLGIYRDGNFIPWDKDIDLAVCSEDMLRIESCADLFAEKGVTFIPEPDSILYKDGEHLDFFPWRLCDNKRVWGLYNIDASDFETPNWVEFLGQKWRIFSQPEKWLQHIYGPDWRTPNKDVHAHAEGPAYEI